jgi:hypothetical protein
VRILDSLLKAYSYLFHLVLCLFLAGLGLLGYASDASRLHLGVVSWGEPPFLLLAAFAGLLSIVLAVSGLFRFLFPLWALAVLVTMVRGFLLGPYVFAGWQPFQWTLFLLLGAFGAFLSSLIVLKRTRR